MISEINNNKLINALEIVEFSLNERQTEEAQLLRASIYSLRTGNFSRLGELLIKEEAADCGCGKV